MNARERLLSIVVGGMVLVFVAYWGFGRYRSALESRQNRVTALEREREMLAEKQLQGALADRRLGDYLIRSLPSDSEKAQADYQNWLFRLVGEAELAEPQIDPTNSIPNQGLYHLYRFKVDGRTDLPGLVELLHAFYAKDYLHRITMIDITRENSGQLAVNLTVEAIGLNMADEDASEPGSQSWRVAPSVLAYQEPILNRNFFEPPNEVPEYQGSAEIEAIVGESSRSKLEFKDPEGHGLRFELGDDAPKFVELDAATGALRFNPEATGEFDLLVRAIDDGYPSRSVEQRLVVKVNDPPVPEQDEPEPEFDDARLTVLTALVEGRSGWNAWLDVRTQGRTVKLRVGDTVEVGSVKAKVIEANPRSATFEVEGRTFELRPGETLADAARQAFQDAADD